MDEVIDYVNEVHAGYLQHRGDRAWLDGLITNFAWLKRAGVQNYLDLVQQVDSREKCEAFLKESGLGFPELISTFGKRRTSIGGDLCLSYRNLLH